VNDRFNKVFQYNTSGLGCWGSLILVVLITATFGFGWIVNSFLIILTLLFVVPVLGFLGLQWWLKRKLVQDQCPVCNYEFTGFKNTQFECPSCGETLQTDKSGFSRITPLGTIDVDAVDVSVQVIEEGK